MLSPLPHVPAVVGWTRISPSAVIGVTVDDGDSHASLAVSDRRRQVLVTLDALALLELAAVLVEAAERLDRGQPNARCAIPQGQEARRIGRIHLP